MTIIKKKIDRVTSALLTRVAKSDLENGLGEVMLNLDRVRKRKRLIMPKKTAVKSESIMTLEDHCANICECKKCTLGTTRTKFVYGAGNPNADILFIGEAPGKDEDEQGVPFVGRAGKLLDKILESIGFSRDDIYIANMLKCRPPGNRDPKPDELELCLPYLAEQIRIIDPKIICALGRISAQALLQTTTPLGKLRGRFHDYHGRLFIVTYHPAALLRFQSYKRDTWEDMKMLLAKHNELKAGK